MLPETTSAISVPEVDELLSVRLPLMRPASSRMPCNPKCPSFPLSAMPGSIPMPLSLTAPPVSTLLFSARARLGRSLYQIELPLLQFILGAGTTALGWCCLQDGLDEGSMGLKQATQAIRLNLRKATKHAGFR
jgi:hypothetical protein